MTEANGFPIDLGESFPHLPVAPIVEAIIDLRAKAEMPWEEQTVRASIDPRLERYTFLDSQRESQVQVQLEGGKPPQQKIRDLGWKGLRYRSADKKNIGQFNRDGFVFRRLPRYENWERFEEEAMRLWAIYLEIANPTQVQRIGLRFINRIELSPEELSIKEYISGGPTSPKGLSLPFHNFMHHDTWAVPGQPYAINVIRVFQALPNQTPAIILDIDVFSAAPFELKPEVLHKQLAEMRWLKNKTFFGIISDKLLDTLSKQK